MPREGYEFTGWRDNNANPVFIGNRLDGTFIMPDRDVELEAQWLKVEKMFQYDFKSTDGLVLEIYSPLQPTPGDIKMRISLLDENHNEIISFADYTLVKIDNRFYTSLDVTQVGYVSDVHTVRYVKLSFFHQMGTIYGVSDINPFGMATINGNYPVDAIAEENSNKEFSFTFGFTEQDFTSGEVIELSSFSGKVSFVQVQRAVKYDFSFNSGAVAELFSPLTNLQTNTVLTISVLDANQEILSVFGPYALTQTQHKSYMPFPTAHMGYINDIRKARYIKAHFTNDVDATGNNMHLGSFYAAGILAMNSRNARTSNSVIVNDNECYDIFGFNEADFVTQEDVEITKYVGRIVYIDNDEI